MLTAALLLGAGAFWAQQTAGFLPVWEGVHCNEWVEQVLSRTKLKDKVGQLFVYILAPWIDKDIEKLIDEPTRKLKVGVFLYSEETAEGQAELTNRVQSRLKVPLMIIFDGERGLSM